MSYGFEDKPLISNPEITFFKIVYHKHSLFSIQDQEINAENDIHFNSSTFFKIRNNGDLFFNPYLKVELPSVTLEYQKTLDTYLQEYFNLSNSKSSTNLILSKINAILFSYSNIKFPIYIKDNLVINRFYDSTNTAIIEQNFTDIYDLSYNNLFQINNISSTNFQKYMYNLSLTSVSSLDLNRNIYYSTYNINYLTTILNSKNYSTTDNIYIDYDIYTIFKNNLYNFITINNENKFLYQIINNDNISTSSYSMRNITETITTNLEYKLEYYYSNMNILYIYTDVYTESIKSKQLKSIAYVTNSSFSDNDYNNSIYTLNNLYDQFSNHILNKVDISRTYFIASGYSLDKKYNITAITHVDISGNSYDISFNQNDVSLNSNIIYFIYPDNNPIHQNILATNNLNPTYEDYIDLYFQNDIGKYKTEIYNIDKLLVPICVLIYNSNSGLFDKIKLSQNIGINDYVFIYNDVFIFNELSQKNQYVLINDYMYEIMDTSLNLSKSSIQYSNSIYIDNPKIIKNNIVDLSNNISYLLYSTNTSLSFIDKNNLENTFIATNFISPYQILYTIDSNNSYYNRLKSINNIDHITLNLDLYNDFIFNKKIFSTLNTSLNITNTYITQNLNKTLSENMLYITNLLKCFLNDKIYFKQSTQITTSSTKQTLNFSSNYQDNFFSNIFTSGNINNTNMFYNYLQNMIITTMNPFLDKYKTYFTKVLRNIEVLPSSDNLLFFHNLSNCSSINSYIQINSVNDSLLEFNTKINDISKSSIYIEINPNYDSSINCINKINTILNIYDCSLQLINNNYYIENIINNNSSTPFKLLPADFTTAIEMYSLMFLLDYPVDINEEKIIKTLYLTPYQQSNTITDISKYSISLDQIQYIYDMSKNHFLDENINDTSNTLETIIDINSILYHYSYKLYIYIRDIIGINMITTNKFATFSDFTTYTNLWNVIQTNTKNVINGNNTIYNLGNTNNNYLDCNINFASLTDHIIINNSISSIIDRYLKIEIRPKIIELINTKTNYFNFFKNSYNFKFFSEINATDNALNIDTTTLPFIQLFYWYLHYLNSIISDVKSYSINYNSDSLFTCILSNYTDISNFIGIKNNIFNNQNNYIGKNLNLSETDYLSILEINSDFTEIINFIIQLLYPQQAQNIQMPDGTINVYTINNYITPYNNILFNTLTLSEILYNLPIYFCNNFFINYKYNNILIFFNQIKTFYINQYSILINTINHTAGSHSYFYFKDLIQFTNFNINEYIEQMDYYRINLNYNILSDINLSINKFNNYISNETIYKFEIVNSIYINDFYNLQNLTYSANDTHFKKNINVLDFMYKDINNIKDNFNKFFNTNYLLNSDYRLIYPLYLNLYSSFKFTDELDYIIYFNHTDININNNLNYMTNGTDTYKFDKICFTDINTNKVTYKIINNLLYNVEYNNYTNIEYYYDTQNGTSLIKTYDLLNYLIIINNSICDQSQNVLYKIIDTSIIDLSGIIIGTINGLIYTINQIDYIYKIDTTKTQILYYNYRILFQNTITNANKKQIKIKNITYNINTNVFSNINTKLIEYYFIIPDKLETQLYFKIKNLSGKIITVYPNEVNIKLSGMYTDTDFSSVFSQTFSTNNNLRTIAYMNNDLQNTFYDDSTNLNFVLLVLLYNNCIKNSIFPSQYYNEDIYTCSSFNNYISSNNLTSSNITEINNIIDWLNYYNNSDVDINEIKIFNQTDQTIHSINDFVNSNLQNKKFYFVPEFVDFFPINSSGQIVQPKNLSDKFYYLNTNHYTYMIQQSQNLKKLSNLDNTLMPFLENIKSTSELIKNVILNKITSDISNSTISNSYDNINNFFDVSLGIATIYDLSSAVPDSNSYFIINSNVITNNEKNNIYDISYGNYQINYTNQRLYLKDISLNVNYLITTNLENIDTYEWDLSNNGFYYKFDLSTNTVLVNVLNTNFPTTLFVYNGLLNRMNRMSFGYDIDSSCNLVYNFKYDLSLNILMRCISKLNNGIFNNFSNCEKYIGETLLITTSYNSYVDLSNNYLTNLENKKLWDSTDILVSSNDIYIVLENYSNKIKSSLGKEYVILYNSDTNINSIFHIATILDISGDYLIKLLPIDNSFVYNQDIQYSLKIGIKHFVDLFGTIQMNTSCVFYYWETFSKSIQDSLLFLQNSSDSYYNNQMFTCDNYIDNLYNKITDVIGNNKVTNNLFEVPELLFNKQISNNINPYVSQHKINTIKTNTIAFYNNYELELSNLFIQLKRPDIPKCSWIQYIGHFLLEKINFKIDNNIIEELDDQIIHNFNFLNSTTSKDIELNKMIGNVPDLTFPQNIIPKKTIYIPLPFFFQKKEKALPVISLLYSKLNIDLKVKDITKLLNITNPQTNIKLLSKLKINLCGSYVFLDTDERIKFAQMRHEYLIKIKKNYKYFINKNIGSLKLDFNLPSPEMFWFYLDNSLLNTNNYSNYTGINYKIYYSDNIFLNNYDQNDDVTNFIHNLTKDKADLINLVRKKTNQSILNLQDNLYILNSGELKSLSKYLSNRPSNPNPFISSSLTYNGHTRFEVDGYMSNLVIPLMYYNDTFAPGLNVYTFCRNPRAITHSGSLNFKYATNIDLNYSIEFSDQHQVSGEINVIFSSFNILRIASGIGCLGW